jgi:hypothetical protein
MFVYLQVLNLLTGCLWITNSISSEAKQTNRSKIHIFALLIVFRTLNSRIHPEVLTYLMLCVFITRMFSVGFHCEGKIDDCGILVNINKLRGAYNLTV